MPIDDPTLPAVRDLTGAAAADVLEPVVAAAGGRLLALRCVQVHYAPGRELIARYEAEVAWATGRASETLLAATTWNGALPGAVTVTADAPSGVLEASVWRWPFDPVLPGLELAVTRARLVEHLAAHLGDPAAAPAHLEVVAYRPTERAVVRVVDVAGTVRYLKVLPPGAVAPFVDRHRAVGAAGVPTPDLLLADEGHGLLLLAEAPGTTLRELVRSGSGAWPTPGAIVDLLERLHRSDGVDGLSPARASRTADAFAHLRFLAAVAPDERDRLARLERLLDDARALSAGRVGPLVHGDLHEAQLFVDEQGGITGLIDLDDLGPGDPVDDPAVLLAHLGYRRLVTPDAAMAERLGNYVARLRAHFGRWVGDEALDATVGAALVGLATGPFRAQAPAWQALTCRVLDAAEALLLRADERDLTPASGAPQGGPGR